MSFAGISSASAADIGHAQIQYGHHHTAYQHVKTYVDHKVRMSYSENSASINALANSLTRCAGSQYQKGTNIFNWVKNNVHYKFYYNSKYGANGALKYRAGNCADQAHLVVALARAAGLKAHYVHAQAQFRSGNIYGHYWAQINANGKWYTADTTSHYNSFGVARNWISAKIEGISNNI